jgi:hypothetical protein
MLEIRLQGEDVARSELTNVTAGDKKTHLSQYRLNGDGAPGPVVADPASLLHEGENDTKIFMLDESGGTATAGILPSRRRPQFLDLLREAEANGSVGELRQAVQAFPVMFVGTRRFDFVHGLRFLP